jgi:hypothetical protein
VSCEEHLSFTREYKQEAVQRLKQNSSLVTRATGSGKRGPTSRFCASL